MRVRTNLSNVIGAFLLSACVTPAMAAGKLAIERAWIRTAPPGAMMLAGYAVLRNVGDEPITVTGASSADFGDVSLHESVTENGLERMRPLHDIALAPGVSVAFMPGGKHFMLMRPRRALQPGDTVKIHISTSGPDGADVEFALREDAP